ncbi:MAG: hypothetical protein ACREHD_04920, partial [Pirellulales bacterium]
MSADALRIAHPEAAAEPVGNPSEPLPPALLIDDQCDGFGQAKQRLTRRPTRPPPHPMRLSAGCPRR